MSVQFELNAQPRENIGKGASRRLRRTGFVPAVLYGAGQQPENLAFEHRVISKSLEQEAFYSQILTIKIGDRSESVILRDLQRHPYKPLIMHMDLQRIRADEKLRVNIPLHFVNENKAPGIVDAGGIVSHLMIDVEISCLPKDLPEYLEVDLSGLGMNESIHLSELKLPEGVEIVQLTHGEEYDVPVANIHHARTAESDEAEEAAAAEAAAEAEDTEAEDSDSEDEDERE